MDSRWARVGRGTIAAALATFVAAFSHALGGDSAPSWFGVAASFVLSVSVCTALAGRTLSWWRLAASIAVSQVLFHTLFSGLGVPTVSPEHGHDDAMTMSMSMPMDAHGERMILAHVIAGIITLLALRFGERAFWSVADAARLVFDWRSIARLLLVIVPGVTAAPRAILFAARTVAAPRTIHVPSTHRHRGPPLQFATI